MTRQETASTERGYTPLPDIATHFLHLHEAALRRNVAYGEGRNTPPDDADDDSEAHNDGKLKGKRRSALRRLDSLAGNAYYRWMETSTTPKDSGAKCLSWNGRFADWKRYGHGRPLFNSSFGFSDRRDELKISPILGKSKT